MECSNEYREEKQNSETSFVFNIYHQIKSNSGLINKILLCKRTLMGSFQLHTVTHARKIMAKLTALKPDSANRKLYRNVI